MNLLEVKTKIGTLTAAPVKDDSFPGIEIRLDNEIVAIVEKSEEKIRTIVYTDKNDEPEEIVDFNSYNKLSIEEYNTLETFYTNGDFIPAVDKLKEEEPFKFLWDDFNLLKSHFTKDEEEKLFFYTLVECDNDESWIIKGKRFVNRIGYFISKVEINIPEEGIRYW